MCNVDLQMAEKASVPGEQVWACILRSKVLQKTMIQFIYFYYSPAQKCKQKCELKC